VILSAGVPLKVVSEVFGTRAMRSPETYTGTSVQRVSREALTQLSDALSRKGGQKRWSNVKMILKHNYFE
jgi:hypothetical protein